ncbi:hypothetical protein BDZ85DRAFT_320535 [Elsinoe ampelina]|uniref:Uncharacterized protein n=1 Tax=Elsinoe ampelina TaxID=302913 RepID=A0A6A6G6V2_9PEZI|nr:hypothetical protein BDZ85DRAFT_320535 [Elsinoe ampelina]
MDTVAPFENAHAKLDAQIQSTGHSKWDFVIYRCTYKSDADWNKMMTKLKEKDAEPYHMAYFNLTKRLRDSLAYTVFEDADLEGASKEVVLKRFSDWVESKPWETEQPQGSRPKSSTRYEICVMVDEASLQSVLNEPQDFVPPDMGEWQGKEEEAGWVYALRHDPRQHAETEEEEYWWMRISFFSLMIGWYEVLSDEGWHHEHSQHPDIAVR